MSKSNTLLSNEQAAIARLSDKVELYKNANQYHKEEKNYMTRLWIKRGQEIEELKARIAILERNHTLVCGQRDTAKQIADMWYAELQANK